MPASGADVQKFASFGIFRRFAPDNVVAPQAFGAWFDGAFGRRTACVAGGS
jgi:uncharacterized protein (DUF1810 family)